MKTKKYKFPLVIFTIFFVFIFILYLQFFYLSVFKKIYGIDMRQFAQNRNTVSTTLYSKRGTIYDSSDNVLAIDMSSYKVIAFLDPSRTGSSKTLYHVSDKERTAKELAPILNMKEEDVYSYLTQENLYQTYLGTKGNDISETQKKKIEDLNLPGIEFEENYKRFYPNASFASYIIGYAKNKNYVRVTNNKTYDLKKILKSVIGDSSKLVFKVYSTDYFDMTSEGVINTKGEGTTTVEIYKNEKLLDTCVIEVTNSYTTATLESKIMGELGIESEYEQILRGINGYRSYQADKYGYKIPDTKETTIDAENGSDIYLTIDSNIQRILESSVDKAVDEYSPEWFTINIMDAKTGDILGSASTPSYNPNDLNTLVNYENPLTSFVYEPGSVMKIYTYMCAIEKGTYKGDELYKSGVINVDGTNIYDWNNVGWGNITFDYGFEMSSNVGVSYMMQRFLNKNDLLECFTKYGFGSKTNIELARELSGTISFNYDVEVAAASYGQGISTTPIQHLQALSMIANDGYMLSPHVVKKITKNGEVTYEREIVKKQVVSKSTTDKLRELMYNTVNDVNGNATGIGYRVEGLDLIGKTGTAQIFDNESGSYENRYIYSFAGMFPKDDPQIIIFLSMKKPNVTSSSTIRKIAKPVIESIAKYKGLIKNNLEITSSKYTLENYINKNVDDVVNDLKNKNLDVVVLGSGDKVINQSLKNGTEVLSKDKIFLLTNKDVVMPDLIGYSRIDAITVLNLLNVSYEIDGYGVVKEQSISKGESITSDIKLTLESEYDFYKE